MSRWPTHDGTKGPTYRQHVAAGAEQVCWLTPDGAEHYAPLDGARVYGERVVLESPDGEKYVLWLFERPPVKWPIEYLTAEGRAAAAQAREAADEPVRVAAPGDASAGAPVTFERQPVGCPACRQPMKCTHDAKEGERVAITCGTPGCMYNAPSWRRSRSVRVGDDKAPLPGYTPTREQFEAAGRAVMALAREQRVRDAAPEMLELLREAQLRFVCPRTVESLPPGPLCSCWLCASAALLARIDGKAGDRG